MDSSGSDLEGMSNNEEDVNEEDSLSRIKAEVPDEADVLARLKQQFIFQEREEREEIEQELKAHRDALRRVERHREALLNSPHSFLAGLAANPAAALLPPASLQAFFAQTAPLTLPHLASTTPTSQNTGEGQWNFDEQFKQLYELSSDPKRKEFLDELFSFMQKRGTPINRLPIMAKQVLDLYELYNLVIARGGLVEVINKKLWQEIIKGLKLPSSITSAAFTLRTQYMKYLYPYECEKKKLSTPADLQAAIDGNRREGRRNGYGNYPDMPSRNSYSGSPLSSQLAPPSLLGSYPTTNGMGYNPHDNDVSPLRPPPPQREALNLTDSSRDRKSALNGSNKRVHLDEDPRYSSSSLSSTNIKVSSRGIDGRSDGSLVVSMEVNGVMYQGVLFAQSHFLASPGTRIS